MSVSGSRPDPSRIDRARSTSRSANSSLTLSCTKTRAPAMQHWPWLKNTAPCVPASAASRSASPKTMLGDFPPSSSDTRLRFPFAASTIFWPVVCSPVNVILSTSGVRGERRTRRLAEARDHVDDPRRKADLGDQLGEAKGGERRLLGGLEDDRVPGRERRAELVAAHEEREVPGDDRADDADRLAPHVRVEAAEGRRADRHPRSSSPSPRSSGRAPSRAGRRRRALLRPACRCRAPRAGRARRRARRSACRGSRGARPGVRERGHARRETLSRAAATASSTSVWSRRRRRGDRLAGRRVHDLEPIARGAPRSPHQRSGARAAPRGSR